MYLTLFVKGLQYLKVQLTSPTAYQSTRVCKTFSICKNYYFKLVILIDRETKLKIKIALWFTKQAGNRQSSSSASPKRDVLSR